MPDSVFSAAKSSSEEFCFFAYFILNESLTVVQVGLKFMVILLPQPPRCSDYRHVLEVFLFTWVNIQMKEFCVLFTRMCALGAIHPGLATAHVRSVSALKILLIF